jgi:hypothetical protein
MTTAKQARTHSIRYVHVFKKIVTSCFGLSGSHSATKDLESL